MKWLHDEIVSDARGDSESALVVDPQGRFWLGRIASEESVINSGLGERGERLDPCAIGVRVKPTRLPATFTVRVSCRSWQVRTTKAAADWWKSPPIDEAIPIELPDTDFGSYSFGGPRLADALAQVVGRPGLSAEVRIDIETNSDGDRELVVQLINTSPERHGVLRDTNLYEAGFRIVGLASRPFLLEALPDSFRYRREVAAYGVNCGVVALPDDVLATSDTVIADTGRLEYWPTGMPQLDLTFKTLAREPLPVLKALVEALQSWGSAAWAPDALDRRAVAGGWSRTMREEAAAGANAFRDEVSRIKAGIQTLEQDGRLLAAFTLMNEAMEHAAAGRYEAWRAFQLGFILVSLPALQLEGNVSLEEPVDVLWFPTGGGKTETYLGLLVIAAIFDRLRGKRSGSTAWSRFPLRMLSLQQTQRFADAIAGAELARRRANIDGDPFSVGFLVGQAGTPNAIKVEPEPWEPDANDDAMPSRFQVLLSCPFCHQESIEMAFNRRTWTLEHCCRYEGCPWLEPALPFYIVDEEIYRFLPTVVVGTLDKVASVAMQGAMRGLIVGPTGRCSEAGHGFTYSSRRSRPNGCLVPGCRGRTAPIGQVAKLFTPTLRLQDELHLLRDSLGAVDAHYESLLDHLQWKTSGTAVKVIASSATLAGFEKQARILYQREGRVFPLPGPTSNSSFWLRRTETLDKRYVGLAPRGVTTDYASDRLITVLQKSVRRLISDPVNTCAQIGIDPAFSSDLVSIYGTDVVYGSTLRDIGATMRSLETQVPVDPLNTVALTGGTPFALVREALDRLKSAEEDFNDRIHVIAASSMLSHGVDIDRLNAMVMLGLPLSTAEFIQTSARIGRRLPGIVIVLHKIGRERDAGVFRSFSQFVIQGDRFIEPIPVTRRSRRVLERTLPGLVLGRILGLHEIQSSSPLTTVRKLREYYTAAGIDAQHEYRELTQMLGFRGSMDELLSTDIEEWLVSFFRNLNTPTGNFTFPSDLCPDEKPMISLRDVESQASVREVIQ